MFRIAAHLSVAIFAPLALTIGERPGKLRKLSKVRHIEKTVLTGSLKTCVSYESGKSRKSGQSGKSKEIFEN
jgi:hypothetical protein